MNTSQYKNRILLSVTGMSPAVVTETLYALVTEKGFIPTEIRVITTLQGKNKLIEALLGIVSGRKERKGALAEFIEDYGQQYGFSHIHFDENCIEVIEYTSGQKLPDIRTPEENELAADQIVKLVGELCRDPESAIHVSIAGGRKTMGFFLGYALSLYGRKQDGLSHVLVSEAFESVKDFFYPKPYTNEICNKGGTLDVSQGKVMLAEIPWVRLGLGISEELISQKISYSDSVKKAQQILDKPSLTFLNPIEDLKVRFGNEEIKLAARGYSLLLSVAISKLEGWHFSAMNNDRSWNTYYRIYQEVKPSADRMSQRLNIQEEIPLIDEVKKIFSESRNDIKKKVTKSFSIGNSNIAYIPSSSKSRYDLFIDIEDIDISEIRTTISHLL